MEQRSALKESPEHQESLEPSTSSMKPEAPESCPPEAKKKREALSGEGCGRDRLKRHRKEMAGRVCIPDTWGKESMLKLCTSLPSAMESYLAPEGISSARRALVVECQQTP